MQGQKRRFRKVDIAFREDNWLSLEAVVQQEAERLAPLMKPYAKALTLSSLMEETGGDGDVDAVPAERAAVAALQALAAGHLRAYAFVPGNQSAELLSRRFWRTSDGSYNLNCLGFLGSSMTETAFGGDSPEYVPARLVGRTLGVPGYVHARWVSRRSKHFLPQRVWTDEEVQAEFDRLPPEDRAGLSLEDLFKRSEGSWIARSQVRKLKREQRPPRGRKSVKSRLRPQTAE